MTHHTVTELFNSLSQSYAVGDFEAIADHYELPGALYLEDDVVVWPNRSALIRFLKAHCRCNHALGARSVRPRVVAQSLKREKHFSAWIDWEHLDEEGDALFVTQARYFFRTETGSAPVIQLVEVPNRPACYASTVTVAPFRRVRDTGRHQGPRRSAPVPIDGVRWYKSA